MNTELYSYVRKEKQTNKHAPLAIMLCLLLLFSSTLFSFSLSTDFYLPPYLTGGNSAATTQSIKALNFIGFTYSNIDYYFAYWNSDTVYCCLINDNGTSHIAAITDSKPSGERGWVYYAHGNNYEGSSINDRDLTSDNVYYVESSTNLQYSSITNNQLPVFNSSQAAIASYLEVETLSGPATVSVEAGCVAYILVDGGRAELSTTFPELSKLSRPMWVTGTTYSYEDELPSSGKVFSSTTGTVVDWLKPAEAKTDLLGRTYDAARPLSDLPSGQYLVVYNPVYRGFDDKGVGIMSPTVYVSLSNYVAVRQYRLTASYNGGIIESTSEDGYTSWFDSLGLEELDDNGFPVYIEHKTDGTTASAITIPTGGGNIVVDTENSDNSIGGLLQRLVNILSAPIRYIEKLFNAGVGFFTMLASLWSWLPEEVSTIIASALVVLVVVGVVKFLWK